MDEQLNLEDYIGKPEPSGNDYGESMRYKLVKAKVRKALHHSNGNYEKAARELNLFPGELETLACQFNL